MANERRLANWLTTYVRDYTIEAEPPELFHIWTGIGVLSTVLGRKVNFYRGHYDIYPNCYIILIAGSAACRKSTALRMGVNLLEELEDANCIKVTRNKITPERLVEVLGKAGQMEMPSTSAEMFGKGAEALIYAPELTTLIDANSHKNGLITILTDLYDCPGRWNNETKNRGCDHLNDVYLNILGATIPSELSSVIPPRVIGSGFTSRCIFVFQRSTPRTNAHPEDFYGTESIQKMKEDLIHDLRIVHALRGNFSWGVGAKEKCTKWYEKHKKIILENEKLDGYMGRKQDHAIKIAMILSAATGNSLVVEENHFISAVGLLDQVEKSMAGVYSLLASADNTGDDIRWILEKMIAAGGTINHSDLQRKAWSRFNAREMGELIQVMLDSELIDRQIGRYQKRIYVLLNEEAIKEILQN